MTSNTLKIGVTLAIDVAEWLYEVERYLPSTTRVGRHLASAMHCASMGMTAQETADEITGRNREAA